MKKLIFGLSGLFLLMVIVGLVFVGVKFGGFENAFISSAQNFNILSVSSPKIVSANPNLNDYPFLILGTFGGAERVIGEISTSRDDYTGKKPILFEANAIQERLVYSILRDTSRPITKYDYTVVKENSGFLGAPTGVTPACPSGYDETVFEDNQISLFKHDKRHCVKLNTFGWAGNLQNPATKFSADISLSNGDEKITKTVTTNDRVIYFDGKQGRIADLSLQGGLVTGDPLPTTNNLKPVLLTGSQWYFISTDAWTQIMALKTPKYNSLINNKVDENDIEIQLRYMFDNRNKQLDTYLLDKVSLADSSWENSSQLDKAGLVVVLDRTIFKQTFTLRVRADWVGIEVLSSKPAITGLSCPSFESASEGILKVTVKNIGDGDGAKYFTSVNGCFPISQKFSAETESITLNSQLSGVVNVELETGAINADISKSCSVKVYDSQDPSLFSQATVTCKVTKVDVCTDGDETRNSFNLNCIDKCVNGQVVERAMCCKDTEKLSSVNGKYICESGKEDCYNNKDDDNDGFIDMNDPECKSNPCPDILIAGLVPMPNILCLFQTWFNQYVKPFIWLIGGIISLLLGGITFFLLKSLTLKLGIKQDKTINTMLTIMSIMATIVYALIFVWQWWIGLILLILLVVLKVVM